MFRDEMRAGRPGTWADPEEGVTGPARGAGKHSREEANIFGFSSLCLNPPHSILT
jgi:hypothetical protein